MCSCIVVDVCIIIVICIIVVVHIFQMCNPLPCGLPDSPGNHLLSQVGIIFIVDSEVSVVDDCYYAVVMCDHCVCVVFSDTVQQWCRDRLYDIVECFRINIRQVEFDIMPVGIV